MAEHRWSGWPGAWCLDCGIEDQFELAIGDGVYEPYKNRWTDEARRNAAERIMSTCAEPSSKRHDPYARIG